MHCLGGLAFKITLKCETYPGFSQKRKEVKVPILGKKIYFPTLWKFLLLSRKNYYF